jgi:hypothetical protein
MRICLVCALTGLLLAGLGCRSGGGSAAKTAPSFPQWNSPSPLPEAPPSTPTPRAAAHWSPEIRPENGNATTSWSTGRADRGPIGIPASYAAPMDHAAVGLPSNHPACAGPIEHAVSAYPTGQPAYDVFGDGPSVEPPGRSTRTRKEKSKRKARRNRRKGRVAEKPPKSQLVEKPRDERFAERPGSDLPPRRFPGTEQNASSLWQVQSNKALSHVEHRSPLGDYPIVPKPIYPQGGLSGGYGRGY